MGKSSIKRADKREGIKPGAHSMNPDRKVANQSKGKKRLGFDFGLLRQLLMVQ
jgi:hypothetical protein